MLLHCGKCVEQYWYNKNTTLKRTERKILMHEIEDISEEERTVETNIEEAAIV